MGDVDGGDAPAISITPSVAPSQAENDATKGNNNSNPKVRLQVNGIPDDGEAPPRSASVSTHRRPSRHSIALGYIPRVSGELSKADLVERRIRHHKIRNEARSSYGDLIRVRASVIPRIFIPALLHTLWGTLWTVLFMVGKVNWFVLPPQLITILGVVISLLLVFRTNTAYDRYWEGRRHWGTVVTNVRNIARFVWVGVQPRNERDALEKKGCMNLLLAFAVATKHYLRNELGHKYTDLHHLLIHLPEFTPGQKHPDIKNLPLEISFHISSYIARVRELELIDMSQQTAMTNALSSLVDCLTSFERIRNTPIPLAYSIHLQQTLTLYILSLPFQLVRDTYWGTIPIIFIAAFTLLGIECIGGEIENPFGYDENDLRVEEFCHTTREELLRVMIRPSKLDPTEWGAPFMEGEYKDIDTLVRAAGASSEDVRITIPDVKDLRV